MTAKQILWSVIAVALFSIPIAADKGDKYVIPLSCNTYYDEPSRANFGFAFGRDKILILSAEMGQSATSYVYFVAGEQPHFTLTAEGKGEVELSVPEQKTTVVKIDSKKPKDYKVATFRSTKDGYMVLHLRLLNPGDKVKISNLTVSGVNKEPVFIHEKMANHFALRGPSCHLNYGAAGRRSEIDWATISVTVPKDYDQEGSYYMALGFDGGYFGIQNNGRGRRNALFSVWNTEDSDNPNTVAEANRVQVVDHGEGVTVKDFGNEGSGKQSFIDAGWQPDHTYRFLLHASRADSNSVDYSAWMYNSDTDKWIYLSTLRRPNTKKLLTGLHSFLENFSPMQGDKTRKAYYHDGWAHRVDGEWAPFKRAFLSCDGTGNNGKRLDFNGGVEQGRYFLMNGGYFDRAEEIDRMLSVDDAAGEAPDIDFTQFNH